MKAARFSPSWNDIAKVILFLMFLFILQTALGYVCIREFSLGQIRGSLNQLSTRIQNDLQYENGKWNTSLYASDPYTPNPTGSSGFLDPLYVFTNDGFVIERNQPISNFLDFSDYKHLLNFQTVQTIKGVTNESWRVLSVPFRNVVITAAYYNPPETSLTDIDAQLQSSIQTIQSSISQGVETRNLDIRTIPYNISFEVVDIYNQVLNNNGRMPTFIDPSYVASISQENPEQIITDSKTKENFLVEITPLNTSSNKNLGVIIAGKSLRPLELLTKTFLTFSFIVEGILILPLTLITLFILRLELNTMLVQRVSHATNKIKSVIFDLKKSKLFIDEREIDIPYGSNQYSLCKLLFSNPRKRFENDEILEAFGEEISSKERKVYDTMIAVNRKTGLPLIVYSSKTYQCNPKYASFTVTRK